jgi:hypothetical protein
VFASFLQDDSTLVRSVILSLQQRMRSWATTSLPTLPLSKMQLEKSISDCRRSLTQEGFSRQPPGSMTKPGMIRAPINSS